MRERPLPVVRHQHEVFTTDQALALGWTSSGLRHAERTGRVDRLWRGVYAAPVSADPPGRTGGGRNWRSPRPSRTRASS